MTGCGKKPVRAVRGGDKGLTLLELMIAVVLLAVVIVVIGGAMRLGYRSMDKGEKRVEILERYKASIAIIDAQIQSGMSLSYTEQAETKSYFEGSREFLKFATNYSIWGGQRGYVIVSYRVEENERGKLVLFAEENSVGVENPREVKLLDDFDDIHFEYFSREVTEEQGEWVYDWPDDVDIPEKIKVVISYGRQNVSVIIPMRAKKNLVSVERGVPA